MSVFARWNDKSYYPGVVLSVKSRRRLVHVHFNDDEQEEWVRAASVVRCNLVPVGVEIMVDIGREVRLLASVISYYTDTQSGDVPAGYNVELLGLNESNRSVCMVLPRGTRSSQPQISNTIRGVRKVLPRSLSGEVDSLEERKP